VGGKFESGMLIRITTMEEKIRVNDSFRG